MNFIAQPVFAQSGTITGRVINEKQQGIADINLGLQGTRWGAASGKNGYFKIKNIPTGNYTFTASGVAFETVRKLITLKKNQNLRLIIHLSQRTEKLQSITVEEKRINPFGEIKSESVAKIPLERLENPQTYSTINEDVFTQQVAVSYKDIFKNISGTMVPTGATNGRTYLSSRGFDTRSLTKDGVSGFSYTTIDPANIAKVEVIKGPSATLYGTHQSSYGGIFNIITKKPSPVLSGNFSYTGGSFGLNRVAGGLNTPLDKNHDVLFRIDAAGEHKNSFKDTGFAKSIFAAPDVSWHINDKLNFEIQGEYYNREAVSPFAFSPYKNTSIDKVKNLGFNFDKSFNPNELAYNGRQVNVHASLHEKFRGIGKHERIL